MPFELGYFSFNFGDGTSYWGGSTTVTHTYPSQSLYSTSLSIVPWYALSPSPVSACINTSSVGIYGCTTSGLTPWQ